MALNQLPLLLHFSPSRIKSPSNLPFSIPTTKSNSFYIFHSRCRVRMKSISLISISLARLDDSQESKELNLSVLRFTLGIPGLDESYLPRWIGLAFGSLLLVNHFLGSNSVTPTQLRSEVLGLFLAGFSISLPYLGKFLKGTNLVDRSTLPEGNKQVFVMQENLSDTQKEDLAWGSYVLLRNTNTMSVLMSVQGVLCARGYWNVPEDASKGYILDLFNKQIQEIGFSDLKDTLYFPQSTDSLVLKILPMGTLSLLVQPVLGAPNLNAGEAKRSGGFILLVSSVTYAYSERDMAWIRAIANKFTGYMGSSLNGF
ncbi:chaperone (DUF2930) isoform X1 [Tasmannia lanceolata]|uniref:chaperone (DUF2930) isoform X1 n=1 Tax=Tasmannia lanceolata TaxID=3420 RepID=UPI0040642B06